MKKRLPKLPMVLKRRKAAAEQSQAVAAGELPKITNETLAEHREEVIGGARKYIYPLQHSKHKIVTISTALFIAAVIGFFSYFTLALYKLKSDSTFLYRVTQVIPFPVAKVGSKFVSYENYLFELRHYEHYYRTQLKLDFNDTNSKEQLAQFKKQALDKVINDAYVKELAAKYHVSVSDKEVQQQIDVARQQNRLGSSNKVFEDVLKDYWGWSLADFRRELTSELLAQKVVATLDTTTQARAQAALDALNSGQKFEKVAKRYSDDTTTKSAGGEYSYPVDKTIRSITVQAINSLFSLKKGQHSQIVNTGRSLDIFKVVDVNGSKLRAAHIQFDFQRIDTYINSLKATKKSRAYIRV